MNFENELLITENENYSFRLIEKDERAILFLWKNIKGLSVQLFQKGINEFAVQCKEHKPTRAVIDASDLDQSSPAMAWLRGQNTDKNLEEYMSWWIKEIVPIYHEAGIASLAVSTGDPNAPGELQEVPPEVNFKVGYFPDLKSAMQWKTV